MRQQEDELTRLKIDVAIVTFEADFFAQAYVTETELKWPLLVDGGRGLYNKYDMLTAGFFDVWNPSSAWAYAKEITKGNYPQVAHDDVRQRGGDVLIDPSGKVRIHHVGIGPTDRPPVSDILEFVETFHQ
ncbi:MAG: hypothetical protein HN348_02595 [Proteobacteria bacterium]|nr:hypothetical protein [Pseudomonadota bacterium]